MCLSMNTITKKLTGETVSSKNPEQQKIKTDRKCALANKRKTSDKDQVKIYKLISDFNGR